ncbi:hypothetical protein F4802DRAFT_620285 [Xylaria palmicola]|nr:hypothetical protein F4802DRAFT_620285 [Xylaria palmicola]
MADNITGSSTASSSSPSQLATSRKGVERPLFPIDLEPPLEFGRLSTVHDVPRGRTPRDGVNSFVYARSGAEAGSINHGIDRGNDDWVRSKKIDIINHPEFEGYYNYEGRQITQLTPDEKRTLEMAVHYPYIQNNIMRAPLYFRTQSFRQPPAEQPEKVRRVFGTPEIFDQIVCHLFPRIEDLGNLCGTSQFIAEKVQSLWMHLDATSHDFLGWDQDCLADVRSREVEEIAIKGDICRRTFSPSIIISPVRPQDQGPTKEATFTKSGYPITATVEQPEETHFANSMAAHYKLLHLSYLNGSWIKHLILHEALGVHQCFLLTLGDTQAFLRIINATNEERHKLEPPRPHISLDFSPFYYKGPAYKADGTGHMGEYGVVPEDTEWLYSTRAVVAQLLGIWNLCRGGGQDFFTPGTGFRAFLERLPIRGIQPILKAIAAAHDFNSKKYHTSNRIISKELEQAMEVTVWQDLIISCNSGPMLQKKLHDLLIARGNVTLSLCAECYTKMPAYFFLAEILHRRREEIICHGCQLSAHLPNHNWRLHSNRRKIAHRIFRDQHWNLLPLRKVLRNISKRAKEGRDAIVCLPGMADSKFLRKANDLWGYYTATFPDELRVIRAAIDIIDEKYNAQPFEECLALSAQRDELEKDALKLEYYLGTNQRDWYKGSLHRDCRSWELEIRDRRADMVIEAGAFVNRSPTYILDFRKNVASMLGRSGGLPEYWNDDLEENSNQKESTASGPVRAPSHDIAQAGATAETQDEGENNNNWNPDNATLQDVAIRSTATGSSTSDIHHDTSNGRETPGSRTNPSPNRVPPHRRKRQPPPPSPIQPATPATKNTVPLSYAAAASSKPTLPPGKGNQTAPLSYAAAAASSPTRPPEENRTPPHRRTGPQRGRGRGGFRGNRR